MSKFGKTNHEDQERRACARPRRTAHNEVTGRRPRRHMPTRSESSQPTRRRRTPWVGSGMQPMAGQRRPAGNERPHLSGIMLSTGSWDCSSSFADDAPGKFRLTSGKRVPGRRPSGTFSFPGLACIPDLTAEIHLDKRVATAPAHATRLFRRT